MKKIELKGIWIPKEILFNDKLNDKEKILLSVILALSTELGYCFASNRYLSQVLNITINRTSKIISSLKDKGFIDIKIIYAEGTKEVKSRKIEIKDNILKGIVILNNTYGQMEQEGIVPKGNYIKNKYNKYYRNIREFEHQKYSEDELESLYNVFEN